MPIERLEIEGLRGFNSRQSMEFAIPNGKHGGGLTILTGANNAGKSTVIEALRARSGHQNQTPSFTVGARNKHTDSVRITYTVNGASEEIRSTTKGGSETIRNTRNDGFHIFVVPSRRSFNPFFGKNFLSRNDYINSYGLPSLRSSVLTGFESRLFTIVKSPGAFNEVLKRVLPFEPDWTIDQSDQGHYFLKFNFGDSSHTSDGMGEGIVSIFCIIDSLYDSNPGDTVVIDEPELSLHPALQRRLMTLLAEYSADRQIVISTHSPYFVDIEAIVSGAHLVRVKNTGEGIVIYELEPSSVQDIESLALHNLYNPHTFGLNARELFFLEDKVILVEGQEDVLLYPKIAEQVNLSFAGEFFGWGVGGADNMPKLCRILKKLGFEKVAGLLDGDRTSCIPDLRKEFPGYFFGHIPTDDIRTKPTREGRDAVSGLLASDLILKEEYKESVGDLINKVNTYLNDSAHGH
jgi:predicted ATPase